MALFVLNLFRDKRPPLSPPPRQPDQRDFFPVLLIAAPSGELKSRNVKKCSGCATMRLMLSNSIRHGLLETINMVLEIVLTL